MIKTILGIILFLIPFLFILKFKDKKKGFFYILSLVFGGGLFIAVFLQTLHIFNYLNVILFNILIDGFVLLKINFKELKKEIKRIKIDWILIIVIVILFIELFSVHYNYSGEFTSVSKSFSDVRNMNYPYPYFSDEWSAVALIKYSIDSGSLPIVNPLWKNSYFLNLELPFHSFVSYLIVLFDLNVFTQYTILTIFSGILICILIYFLLRFSGISKISSSITALSIPYIVNGANLPGIWTLIPLILGLIFFLLSLIFMEIRNNKMMIYASFMTLIFYPPMVVMNFVSVLGYYLLEKIPKKQKIFKNYFLILLISAGFIASFVVGYFFQGKVNGFFSYIFSKIFYETFTKNAIPNFSMLLIVPIWCLIFFVFGLVKLFKTKKYFLLFPVFVGFGYWLLYSKVLWRFILEYERVVVVSSILVVLISGFGLEEILKFFKKNKLVKNYYYLIGILYFLVLLLFFYSSFSYTSRDNWKNLKLYAIYTDKSFNPAALANNYLTDDDLRIFSQIHNKKFISVPWKGLVIGVVAENYPLETKPSTITNIIYRYNYFMKKNCNEKLNLAKKYGIDYVYSYEFDCPKFNYLTKSSEGFYLYEVEK